VEDEISSERSNEGKEGVGGKKSCCKKTRAAEKKEKRKETKKKKSDEENAPQFIRRHPSWMVLTCEGDDLVLS